MMSPFRRLIGLTLLMVVGLLGFSSLLASRTADELGPSPALQSYLDAEDPTFEWSVLNEGAIGETKYAELRMTSQTWRDIEWKHQLFVIRPSTCDPDVSHALMFITGGSWGASQERNEPVKDLPREARLFATVAEQLKTPVAVLLQVPFQPIFDNLYEDEIISHTFQKFAETEDPTWPLLLPMVKSAVRGMDVSQTYFKDSWELDVRSFTVSGASKRGWTTWLTGATDDRATAIAPMVIDVLNMAPQMDHQKAAWGGYSSEIEDYSEKGLQDLLTSDVGKRLRRIVDPYSYRKQLTQPKLVMLGTNDAYWPVDALNLYWNDLVGEKYILYVPNQGHGLDDLGRVVGTIHGFHMAARDEKAMPKMKWKFDTTDSGLTLRLSSDEQPETVSLWVAESEDRDFRKARWKSQTLRRQEDGSYMSAVPFPESGFTSFFMEANYDRGALPMFLSTNLRVLGSNGESTPENIGSDAKDSAND